jgi:hypothetical protein
MSIYTVTVDDVMRFDKKTLAYALRIFQQELDGILKLLLETPEAATDEKVLDDLNSALTLRKVYMLRLEELTKEEAEQAQKSQSLPMAASTTLENVA